MPLPASTTTDSRDATEVDQLVQVRRIVREHVALRDRAGFPVVGRDAGLEHYPNLAQPGLLPDRSGTGAAKLDSVVFRRVMAGGEHRARQVQRPGREIQQVGRAQARFDDVRALTGRALGKSGRQRNG